ncbi:MAG: response regulator transcription factor [Desulfobacteraceae bacterium]|nr:response regulator transcription factor [Desulfobacteraceae bacterium]
MKKPLILVVDDVEQNLQLIGKMLETLDVDISFATSGAQALSLLKTIRPSLIILDIVMPAMNGFELCTKIGEQKELKEIPVLFLSAKNAIEDVVAGFKVGAKDYLTKPIIKEELLARVETQLAIKNKSDRLIALNKNLEQIVSERTEQLRKTNEKLQEYNTALKVLLEKKDENKEELEKKIVTNINDLCLPMINKLKNTKLDEKQRALLESCEKSIQQIVSPHISSLKTALKIYGFTVTELNVIELIREGLTTGEISTRLNTSESAINFHRNNIRKKLGLKKKKVNLQIYLNKLGQ